MIGEDADLDKSGRILNRVIEWGRVTEWGRDGITIEADQRHVREMLGGLELERANPAATPCAVENKSEVMLGMMEARERIDGTETDTIQARAGRRE